MAMQMKHKELLFYYTTDEIRKCWLCF